MLHPETVVTQPGAVPKNIPRNITALAVVILPRIVRRKVADYFVKSDRFARHNFWPFFHVYLMEFNFYENFKKETSSVSL